MRRRPSSTHGCARRWRSCVGAWPCPRRWAPGWRSTPVASWTCSSAATSPAPSSRRWASRVAHRDRRDLHRVRAARRGARSPESMSSVTTVRGAAMTEPNSTSAFPPPAPTCARGAGPTFTGVNGAGVLVGDVDTGVDYDHGDFKDAARQHAPRAASGTRPTHAARPGRLRLRHGVDRGADQRHACTETDTARPRHARDRHRRRRRQPDRRRDPRATPTPAWRRWPTSMFVKTTFTTTAILDGVSYIFGPATARGKNAVVNLSLGSHYGPHDGTSDFEAGLGAADRPGRIVVKSAGNERGRRLARRGVRRRRRHQRHDARSASVRPAGRRVRDRRLLRVDREPERPHHARRTARVIGPIALGSINAAYPGATLAGNGTVYVENGVALTGDRRPRGLHRGQPQRRRQNIERHVDVHVHPRCARRPRTARSTCGGSSTQQPAPPTSSPATRPTRSWSASRATRSRSITVAACVTKTQLDRLQRHRNVGYSRAADDRRPGAASRAPVRRATAGRSPTSRHPDSAIGSTRSFDVAD